MNDASNKSLVLNQDEMQCFVYKGSLKDDHFLFLPCLLEELNASSNKDTRSDSGDTSDNDLDSEHKLLPEALLKRLGDLSFVTEFTLRPERFMPQADPVNVMADLSKQGFYLQMPKTTVDELEDSFFK